MNRLFPDLFSPVANACRQEMVGLLMRIRANREYHIYLAHDDHPDKEATDNVTPSPFIHCQKRREADSRPSMPPSQPVGTVEPITHCAALPFTVIYDTVRTILTTETQWEIYLLVVQGIIPMLRNKYLIMGSEIDPSKLCALLCDLIMKDKLASNVFEIPLGRSRSELYYHAYHALVILVSYHTAFSRALKDELLMCFKKGLASKWRDLARPCVYALRLCALELQQQITRFLPGILTDLNKVSFKHTMAIPILEFLSGLIRAPPLYANFTEDHYKLIFGLVLYYTDYIKYPPYIVSLAYHVISVWFIRCRLSYRKKFAPFILNGLMLNRPMGSVPIGQPVPGKEKDGKDHASSALAEENLEACLDMLSRYTYASCNTDPRRTEAIEQLLGTAKGKAWVYGTAIIVVTMSPFSPWGEIAVHRTTGAVAWLFRCLNRQYTRPGDLFTSVPGLMAFLKRDTKFPTCPEVEINPLPAIPPSADSQPATPEHTQEEEEHNFTVSNPHQPEIEPPQPGEPAIDYNDADEVAAAIAAGDIDFPSVIVGRIPLRRISAQQDPVNLSVGGGRPRSLSTGSIPVPSPVQHLGFELADGGSKLRVPSLGPPLTRGIDEFALDIPSEGMNLQLSGKVSSGIVSEPPKLQDIQSGKELDIVSVEPIQPEKPTNEHQSIGQFHPTGPKQQPEAEISLKSEKPAQSENPYTTKQETTTTTHNTPGEYTEFVASIPPSNSQNENSEKSEISEKTEISGEQATGDNTKEKGGVEDVGGHTGELQLTQSSPAIMLDRPPPSEDPLPVKSSSHQLRRFVAPSSVFFPPLLSYEGAGDQASQLIMSPGFWDVGEEDEQGEGSEMPQADSGSEKDDVKGGHGGESKRFGTDSEDSDTEGGLRATPSKYVPNIRSRHNSASTSSPHALVTLSLEEQMVLHSRTGTDEDTVVLEPGDGGASIVVGVGVNVLKAPDLEHVSLVPKEHTSVFSPRSHVHRKSRLSIEGTMEPEEPDPPSPHKPDSIQGRGDVSPTRFESAHPQPTLEIAHEQPKTDGSNPTANTNTESTSSNSDFVSETDVDGPRNEPSVTGRTESGQTSTQKTVPVKQATTTTTPPKVPLPSLHPSALVAQPGPNAPNPTHENADAKGLISPRAHGGTGFHTAPTTPTLHPLPTLDHLADEVTPSSLSLPVGDGGLHAISEDEKHRRESTGCVAVGLNQMQQSTVTAPSTPPAPHSPNSTVYASPLVQNQTRNSAPLVASGAMNSRGLNPPVHRILTPTLTTPTPTGRGSPTDVPSQQGQRQSLVSQKQEEGGRDPRNEWQLPDPTNNEMLSSFLMVQLYQLPSPSTPPLPIRPEEQASYERAMRVLQKIPTRDTHKIGVVYVGEGQASGDEILRNEHGSVRYVEFLSRLGTLTRLKGADVYTGGLDREDNMDGEFAYHWQDDITEVIFHVATLMPHNDPSCLVKKRHIGNDYVTIVYNDSKKPYNLHAIKGQFNFVDVIIQPLEDNTNEVLIRTKEVMQTYVPEKFDEIVSEASLGSFVRNIAIHANLASLIQHLGTGYVTNWVERLRSIKRIGERMVQPLAPVAPNDFTAFT